MYCNVEGKIEGRKLNDMDCILKYVSPVYPPHHYLEEDLQPNINMTLNMRIPKLLITAIIGTERNHSENIKHL